MSGRDVAIACMLGAEEFGFATAPLVAMGCVHDAGMQPGHLPGGHRHPEPRAAQALHRQAGICDELHDFSWPRSCGSIMARLGVRSVEELVGRGDLLRVRQHQVTHRAATIDMSSRSSARRINEYRRPEDTFDFHTEKTVDERVLLKKLQPEEREAAERRAGRFQHGPGLRHHFRQRSDPRSRHIPAQRTPTPSRQQAAAASPSARSFRRV